MSSLQRIAAVVLGISVLAGCSSTTSIDSLGVGDCFSGPEASVVATEVSEVDTVDCSDPHRYEMFAVKEMTNSSFPGESQAADMADDFCLSSFKSYVGLDYDNSIYWISSVSPTSDSWSRGDRSIQCALGLDYGSKVGSARNSRE
ncbi:MAG: septum formation family protein [Acidimicrobiales bacterium]|jgi:hypothetical protein|nr:septum formation family protein [Acidimicrobiales bacterium]